MEQTRTVRSSQPDSRPAFGKIMFPANLYDVRLPLDFKKHLATENNKGSATLKTQWGSWGVGVIKHEGEFYLSQGWQEFVKSHHLEGLEYLVFYYNGGMQFDVDIYEETGWKRRTCREPGSSSFTSPHPYFEIKLCSYHIGSKSYLVIPKSFHSKHFDISERTAVVLRNPDGISWLTAVIVSSARGKKQLLMSQGWKKFADDNSLKKGDTCIFELVEQEVMQVHIFRSA